MKNQTDPEFAKTLIEAATVMPMLRALVRMSRERRLRPAPVPAPASTLAA